MEERLPPTGRTPGQAFSGSAAIRSLKNARNAVVDRAFRVRGRPAGRAFAHSLEGRGERVVAFSIAFNAPWAIGLLVEAWRRRGVGMTLAVIDNSNDSTARSAHRRLCHEAGVPYLGLPWNPEWSPNRSHGIALNWVWFNVVRHLTVDLVGFVDHDCIPVAPIDLPGKIATLSAYGLRCPSETVPDAWNMWAGYSFLRPSATVGRTIDFKHRPEFGLDTGGGNWPGLYSRLQPDEIGSATARDLILDPRVGGLNAKSLLIDEAFLHLEGASYISRFADETYRNRLVSFIRQRFLNCDDGTVA